MTGYKSKSLVIWCHDAPNQKALVCKIASEFNVTAIVIEKRKRFRVTLPQLINKVFDRIIFRHISWTWQMLQKYYSDNYHKWPDVSLLQVSNINQAEVIEFTNKQSPDLIVVSGTSIIKKELLGISPSIGIINLHTGLSPYVKGGPNCTNWCIANGKWHLIGNTIMWINKGIDSGNIITNRAVDISGCRDLLGIHKKVMDEAHALYMDAIRYLLNSDPPFISVPQKNIGQGKLYLTKMWTNKKKWQLLANMKALRAKKIVPSSPAKTISLP